MMYCATFAIPNGSTATITRSTRPDDTTPGPESHRIPSTGGIFFSARSRSRHGLSRPSGPSFTCSPNGFNECSIYSRDQPKHFPPALCLVDAKKQPGVGSFRSAVAHRRLNGDTTQLQRIFPLYEINGNAPTPEQSASAKAVRRNAPSHTPQAS